jgi:hypothetical protein
MSTATATPALPSGTFIAAIEPSRLAHPAERDNAKRERLELFKLASGLGNPKSIHARLFDWWAELDATYFDGQLDPVLIHLGITEWSGCLGMASMVEGQARIVLHQGLMNPGWGISFDGEVLPDRGQCRWGSYGPALGKAFLKDVLLHEMMHQAQAQLFTGADADWHDDGHNCASWISLCNRVASRMGLGVWFPLYVRRKAKADAQGKRANVWVATNADQCPAGLRMAEFDELRHFPHLTKTPGDYKASLAAYSWEDLKDLLIAYRNRNKPTEG